MKPLTALLFVFLLATACSDSDLDSLSIRIEPVDLEFTVQARGEVLASESTSVNVPAVSNMPLYLSWLIEEFSAVETGQVVARLDDSEIQMNERLYDTQIANYAWQLQNMSRNSEIGRKSLTHERVRVDGESDIAQTFADFDPRYFSRIEIIDAIGDLNYLGVEADFYDWQIDTHDQRSVAEAQQSQAQLTASERNYQVYQDALEIVELRSPADGTFIYARTPWGEKLGRGSPAFPGSKVGMIPIKGKVKARIFVPKSEAQDIAQGQSVRLRLDGLVEDQIPAKVSSISRMATIRIQQDPRKYFIVEATIDQEDVDAIRVGTGLQATIVLADLNDALVLPTQAIFFEDDLANVYVVEDGDLVYRAIEVGRRSPTLIEVTSGVESGEIVSLVAPESASSSFTQTS